MLHLCSRLCLKFPSSQYSTTILEVTGHVPNWSYKKPEVYPSQPGPAADAVPAKRTRQLWIRHGHAGPGGIFEGYKHLPTLSLACTDEGLKTAEDMLHNAGFQRVMQWVPETNSLPGLDINAMPNYAFETFDYPKAYKSASPQEKEELLLDMRLKLQGGPRG